MYKAPITQHKRTGKLIGEMYYDKFASVYRTALQKKLDNRKVWTEGIYGHKNKKVLMKILPGSKAETFIKHCIKSDSFFRTLLYGDLDQMFELFQVLKRWLGSDWELEKLSNQDKLSISQQQNKGLGPVCHFHSVVRRVFVNALYENELTKELVFRWKNLSYCPYCGDESVFMTNHVGYDFRNVVSKTVLDHYLPKSEYPYFAVNIYNLFPCCWRCNSDDKKGDKKPIEIDAAGIVHPIIMHPHLFDEGRLKFVYIPRSQHHPDDDIELMCSDLYLEKGYKQILGLEAHYKNHKVEARNMIERAGEYLSLHAIDYGRQTYGFDKKFLQFYIKSTLSFDAFKEKPKNVQRYKFKMDIFRQIHQLYKIQLI